MKVKSLYTNSQIFFPDPYVIRIEYKDMEDAESIESYRKIIRKTYELIEGTWGYSKLVYEYYDDTNISLSNVNGIYQQISQHYIKHLQHGYICFKDEMDALQFRLSIDTTVIRVFMWPKNLKFTIHVVTDSDASISSDI